MGALVFQMLGFFDKNKVEVFSLNYALYDDKSDWVMKTLSELVLELEVYYIDEAFVDLRNMPYEDLEELAPKI